MSGTTTFTWTSSGANNTDWNLPANWEIGSAPATVAPKSGTASVIINNPTLVSPVISGGSSDTVANLDINVAHGNPGLFVGGNTLQPSTGAGTLTVLGTLTVGSGDLVGSSVGTITAATLNVAAPGILGGGGTFTGSGPFVNSGDIQADGGLYGLGPLTINAGSITGAGSLEIDGNSTLSLNASTAQTLFVNTAVGETAHLNLGKPTGFTGPIDFFGSVTALDAVFQGQTITGAAISPSGLLTVTGAGGAVLDSIQLTGRTPGTTATIVGPSEVNLVKAV
jgi:hypothetical protein